MCRTLLDELKVCRPSEAMWAEWALERWAMQATNDELTTKVDQLERELGKRDKFQREDMGICPAMFVSWYWFY